MGIANFIKKHFIGKEICITLLGGEAETLNYDQSSASNREFFRGLVEDVEEGVVVLNIEDQGTIYITENFIRCFWEPSFDYHKALNTSITKKMVGARR